MTIPTIEMNEEMNNELLNKLRQEARYLHIAIPYDKDDKYGLITFDDGLMTELECDEDFTPPMLNEEDQLLEVVVDLKERKILDRKEDNGYLRLWAKVCDSGTYTLLDAEKNPLWQIDGYVPNAMIPPYENSAGDYLELAIEHDGSLPQWQTEPDFSDFLKDGQEPKPVKTNKWHQAEDAYYDVMRHHLNQQEMIWLIQRLLTKSEISMKQLTKEIMC